MNAEEILKQIWKEALEHEELWEALKTDDSDDSEDLARKCQVIAQTLMSLHRRISRKAGLPVKAAEEIERDLMRRHDGKAEQQKWGFLIVQYGKEAEPSWHCSLFDSYEEAERYYNTHRLWDSSWLGCEYLIRPYPGDFEEPRV